MTALAIDQNSTEGKALQQTVRNKLREYLGAEYSDDVLPLYIVVMLAHGNNEALVAENLQAFLGEQEAAAFAAWLFQHVESDGHLYEARPQLAEAGPTADEPVEAQAPPEALAPRSKGSKRAKGSDEAREEKREERREEKREDKKYRREQHREKIEWRGGDAGLERIEGNGGRESSRRRHREERSSREADKEGGRRSGEMRELRALPDRSARSERQNRRAEPAVGPLGMASTPLPPPPRRDALRGGPEVWEQRRGPSREQTNWESDAPPLRGWEPEARFNDGPRYETRHDAGSRNNEGERARGMREAAWRGAAENWGPGRGREELGPLRSRHTGRHEAPARQWAEDEGHHEGGGRRVERRHAAPPMQQRPEDPGPEHPSPFGIGPGSGTESELLAALPDPVQLRPPGQPAVPRRLLASAVTAATAQPAAEPAAKQSVFSRLGGPPGAAAAAAPEQPRRSVFDRLQSAGSKRNVAHMTAVGTAWSDDEDFGDGPRVAAPARKIRVLPPEQAAAPPAPAPLQNGGDVPAPEEGEGLEALRAKLAAMEGQITALRAEARAAGAAPVTDPLAIVAKGLHLAATPAIIAAHFSGCGQVTGVNILRDAAGQPSGIAYVEFAADWAARKALELTGSQILRAPIEVSPKLLPPATSSAYVAGGAPATPHFGSPKFGTSHFSPHIGGRGASYARRGRGGYAPRGAYHTPRGRGPTPFAARGRGRPGANLTYIRPELKAEMQRKKSGIGPSPGLISKKAAPNGTAPTSQPSNPAAPQEPPAAAKPVSGAAAPQLAGELSAE